MAFYTEHLGFQIEMCWPFPQPTFAILRRDTTRIGFFEPTEQQPGPIGYVELYIEVIDARALHVLLEPNVPIEWGGVFVRPPRVCDSRSGSLRDHLHRADRRSADDE